MYGTVGWIVLLGAGIVVEVLGRLHVTHTPSLARTGALLAARWTPRILLLLFWIFVGLHLFTRYTIPAH
jgi:hypothetical protein